MFYLEKIYLCTFFLFFLLFLLAATGHRTVLISLNRPCSCSCSKYFSLNFMEPKFPMRASRSFTKLYNWCAGSHCQAIRLIISQSLPKCFMNTLSFLKGSSSAVFFASVGRPRGMGPLRSR